MVLINIIDILSKNYPVQIRVNGSLINVFEHADEIPYKYLNLRVERIYPCIIDNTHKNIDGVTGLNPVAPKAVLRLDLETFENKDCKSCKYYCGAYEHCVTCKEYEHWEAKDE